MPHVEFDRDGERWPSVTQITSMLEKPFLYRWYGRLGWKKCEAIKKESQLLGRTFHEIVDARLGRREPVLETPEYYRKAEKMADYLFEEWIIPHDVEPMYLEQHVVSEKYKYHGTFDAIVKLKNQVYIIDWKTSGQMSPEMALQLSAYALAWNEAHDLKIYNGGIVRVDKKTCDVEVKTYADLERYYGVFVCLRQVWDWVNGEGAWKDA